MSTDGVQAVGTKLVVALHDLEDIELKASVDVRLLRVAVLDFGLDACVCERERETESARLRDQPASSSNQACERGKDGRGKSH
jgi:hypothetical protein